MRSTPGRCSGWRRGRTPSSRPGSSIPGRGRFAVQVPGIFESLSDLLNMPLRVSGDSAITVRDIASVRRTFKDQATVARVNGKPALSVEVSKRTGENIIDTTNAVRRAVEAERVHWPPGVEVRFSQDRSDDIRTMLKDLENNVTSAILLVMIIVVAALGLRSGFLVGIAIPGSFLTGILVLATLGLTVNIVVLFSLILAVGMLVDGAIVVTEYADRKMREGELPRHAYVLAARRMSWPIIASTATTLAAFAPLLFWPGIVGEFMKYLPITLLATLSASLLMALVFVPVLGTNLAPVTRGFLVIGTTLAAGMLGAAVAFQGLGAWFGGPPGLAGGAAGAAAGLAGGWLGWLAGRRLGGWSDRTFLRRPVETGTASRALRAESDVDPATLPGVTGVYVRSLARVLRRPGSVLVASGAALVLAWGAYTQFGKGVEFFPDVEPEQAKVLVHARGNLSVAEKAELVGEVEAEILEMQRERGEFNTIYMLAGDLDHRGDDPEDVIGTVSLEFADWQTRRNANAILGEVRERTARLAGIRVETRFPRAGPPVGKPVALELTSRDPAVLAAEADRVAAFFRQLDGLKDIEDGRPIPGIEWEIGVDRTQAAKFGLDVATIGQFVQLVTRGLTISDYRPDDSDEEIELVIRYPETYRTIDELDRIRFPTAAGGVPIGNFVERRARPRTGTLRRKSAAREITVRADVLPGVLADDKVREIAAWIDAEGIDPRVEWTFRGEDEEQQQARAFLSRAFGGRAVRDGPHSRDPVQPLLLRPPHPVRGGPVHRRGAHRTARHRPAVRHRDERHRSHRPRRHRRQQQHRAHRHLRPAAANHRRPGPGDPAHRGPAPAAGDPHHRHDHLRADADGDAGQHRPLLAGGHHRRPLHPVVDPARDRGCVRARLRDPPHPGGDPLRAHGQGECPRPRRGPLTRRRATSRRSRR